MWKRIAICSGLALVWLSPLCFGESSDFSGPDAARYGGLTVIAWAVWKWLLPRLDKQETLATARHETLVAIVNKHHEARTASEAELVARNKEIEAFISYQLKNDLARIERDLEDLKGRKP